MNVVATGSAVPRTSLQEGADLASTLLGIAALPAALVLTIVVALLWAVRPWELKGGSWLDRLRVGEAVNNYDFWLSVRGVGGRRRRDLRDELRANLWDATARVGSREALKSVGSTRRLAFDSALPPSGPRWGFGLGAGLLALELVVMLQLFAVTVWSDAALAAKVTRLEGPVTLLPGTRATFEQLPSGGFTFGANLGPMSLVVAVLVFVLVARPWRLRSRRPAGAST